MNAKVSTNEIVALSAKPVIAQGGRQYVYEHPLDPTSLIKIAQPETYDRIDAMLLTRRWLDKFRRATAFGDFLREFREYVELKGRFQQPGVKLPICAVKGVVQTDLGLGLVYERISEPNGKLSPDLKSLIRSGRIRQRHFDDFDLFFQALRDCDVVACDMSFDNLVYQTDTDGQSRIVWIDSFGSKRPIPVRRWFRSLNHRKIRQVHEKRLAMMTKLVSKAASTADSGKSGADTTPST